MDLSSQDGRQELGRRIQRAILEAGFASLPLFAQTLGWSRALVYQYVNGAVLAQLDRLQQVAHATRKPLEWFLADDPEAASRREGDLEERVARAQARLVEVEQALSRTTEELLEARSALATAALGAARDRSAAIRRGYDPARLLEAATEWATLAEQLDDRRQRAAALVQVGHAWLDFARPVEARHALEEALPLADTLGEERLARSARQELVRALQALGEMDEACRWAEVLAASDDWWARWAGLVTWAGLLEQRAEYNAAAARLREAEAVVESPAAPEEHQPLARAYLATNRVNIVLGQGRYRDAVAEAEAGRRLAQEAGARGGSHQAREQELEALLNLGLAWMRSARAAEADDALAQACRWAEITDDLRRRALALALRAELWARTGRPTTAKDWAREAAQTALGSQQRLVAAWAALAAGVAHDAAAQAEDAQYWFRQAAEGARAVQARRLELEARTGAAVALLSAATRAGPNGGPSTGRRTIHDRLLDLAAEADSLGILDVAAAARAWAAYSQATNGSDREQAEALARQAAEQAQAIRAEWALVVARGAQALALVPADPGRAAALIAEGLARVLPAARGLGIKLGAAWHWLDLRPLAAAHRACRQAAHPRRSVPRQSRRRQSNGGDHA